MRIRRAGRVPYGWTLLTSLLWALAILVLAVPGASDDVRDRAFELIRSLLNFPVIYLAFRLGRSDRLDWPTRRAWWLLSGAFGCAALASATQRVETATEALAVVGNLGGVIALLTFPTAGSSDGRRRWRSAMDVTIGFVGALMVYWTFVLVPHWTTHEPLSDRIAAMRGEQVEGTLPVLLILSESPPVPTRTTSPRERAGRRADPVHAERGRTYRSS
ncbi:hypothetical protein [Virgisporangium aurantiacum]|uniref:Uncharacterized protein n=1 Tax=Virgisporangium aurantiacum TaxID=175570 RepID=A0A8J4E6G3_9ACTN|nr:hypothetical protein [Virgisporangium aurantiacum]GIJ63204.1 hypothetical protein Vau01_107200 [Virgisporangium aurantiacum]